MILKKLFRRNKKATVLNEKNELTELEKSNQECEREIDKLKSIIENSHSPQELDDNYKKYKGF